MKIVPDVITVPKKSPELRIDYNISDLTLFPQPRTTVQNRFIIRLFSEEKWQSAGEVTLFSRI